MRKLSIITLFIVLLGACSKKVDQLSSIQDETPQTKASQKSQVSREVKGNIYSTINLNSSVPPMPCTGDLPGLALPEDFLHGTASHTGELIWQQSNLVHTSCNLSFTTRQLTTTVSGQLAASNGDIIYYTGNDVIDVTNLLTGVNAPGTIQCIWTITGGTGRFDGASGSLTINGAVDFSTSTFSGPLEGTINY